MTLQQNDVLIGHPSGNGFSFHAALSLLEMKRLQGFCVPWIPSRLELLTLKSAGKIHRGVQRLERRAFLPLKDANVIQGRIAEFSRLLRRSFGGADTSERMAYEANDWLMKTMAANVHATQTRFVHAYEDCSQTQFEIAKKLGKFCVYDLPIGFHREWSQIQQRLSSEYRNWLPEGGLRSSRFARPDQKDAEMELAEAVLAPSEFVLQTVRKYYPNKALHLTPYGVDVNFWRPAEGAKPKGPLRFLFVGQLGVRKGTPVLLNAWKEANLSDCRLDLAGSWDLGEQNRSEIRGNIHYHGMLSREELLKLFQSADVFLFPSFFEGFALTALEAMACGLPIITTEVIAGMDLVNSSNGRIIPSGSVQSLASAISELSDQRSDLFEMGRKARESVSVYSWENYRKSIKVAYDQFSLNDTK